MRTILLWLGAVTLGAVGLAGAERGDTGAALGADYRLGPGDVVDITVFEIEELSKPAVLAADGTVALPLIGVVGLGAMSTREAAERLRELYSDNLIRHPQVTVTVREYHSRPVFVLGAVHKPGMYLLRGPRRLWEVVALAEGPTPEAGGRILLSRPQAEGGEKTLTIPLSGLVESPSGRENNPWVQPHDTIRVSRAGVVYVLGEVGRPGGFPLRDQESITVLKVLALAEGLRRTAAPQHAKVFRRRGAQYEETLIRVRDILQGRAPDPLLQAEDVLFIPNSRARSAMGRTAEALVQVTTGVIIWRR